MDASIKIYLLQLISFQVETMSIMSNDKSVSNW